MNDTIKLLTAIAEAQGLVVEVVTPKASDLAWNFGKASGGDVTPLTADYKVTYKNPDPMVPLPIHSDAWSCLVDFLLAHRDDIINDINDYGGLGSMLDFIERDKR